MAAGCGGKDKHDPFETAPSGAYEENLVRAFITRDWNGVRIHQLPELKSYPQPEGLDPAKDTFACKESKSSVERMVIKDPSAYDAKAPVEVAYICVDHGSYWYSFESKKEGKPLKAVYGPFRMRRSE